MGATHLDIMQDKTRTRTIREWAEMSGTNADTIRKKASRTFRTSFGILSGLTSDQWEEIYPDKTRTKTPGNVRDKAKRVLIAPRPSEDASAAEPQRRRTFREVLDGVRAFALDAILVTIVVGHAGLIWYDCAIQWATPGTIGGGIAFSIVLAAVLLATDETRIRTSQSALYFVFLVDACAWFVHVPTFQTAGVPDEMTWAFAGFLCATSWVALFLYRDKNLN